MTIEAGARYQVRERAAAADFTWLNTGYRTYRTRSAPDALTIPANDGDASFATARTTDLTVPSSTATAGVDFTVADCQGRTLAHKSLTTRSHLMPAPAR